MGAEKQLYGVAFLSPSVSVMSLVLSNVLSRDFPLWSSGQKARTSVTPLHGTLSAALQWGTEMTKYWVFSLS